MATHTELNGLLEEIRESLDVEVKSWLDLTNNDHRALLAKEVIALANHGGGFIIVGFREAKDGSFEPDLPRPADLAGWSQNLVQGVVSKYVDPGLQCVVHHHALATTGDVYPIIAVPGDHRVPVKAKAGSPDGQKLVAHRIYVRRPGPSSDEPKSAQEWDRVLERCLQNRKADLLEAMRSIMAGVIPGSEAMTPTVADRLAEFEQQAIHRWTARVAALQDEVPAKLSHGHYDSAFALDGQAQAVSMRKLSQIVENEVRSHSGWPPFLTIGRDPFLPKPIEGAVECWIGPEEGELFQKPSHHDFWRISPAGLLFTRRGYQEDDGFHQMTPGTSFDIVSPVWRLGEAIMEASYIANAIGGNDLNLICRCRYTKLGGRTLVSEANPRRSVRPRYIALQDEYSSTETVAIRALPSALPEIVLAMLEPLYQLFDFFSLPKRLVEEELASLLRQRF